MTPCSDSTASSAERDLSRLRSLFNRFYVKFGRKPETIGAGLDVVTSLENALEFKLAHPRQELGSREGIVTYRGIPIKWEHEFTDGQMAAQVPLARQGKRWFE